MLLIYRFVFALLLVFIFTNTSVIYAQSTILVDVINPSISKRAEKLTLSGTATAVKRSKISPRVEGLINFVAVDAGSYVDKGDVLLKLDQTLSQFELRQIKANIATVIADRDEALRRVNEALKLVERKHIPETELEIRKAALALKQAQLQSVEAELATQQEIIRRHVVYAPFSGVISDKLSEEGEWVSPGDQVLELVSLEAIRLEINVPQERFSDINKGSAVTVYFDIYPNTAFQGHVDAVVPVSDKLVRAFMVRVAIDNENIPLLPGASATAEFQLKKSNSPLLVIPRDAILNDPDGSHSVFVIEDNKAVRHKISLGTTTEEGVTVKEGITLDDLIVIRGNEVLSEQQPVKINSTGQ